ncbi:hypothetical protein [Pararhizobium sp.]|uniref:hypothetical protein n=1 Tax=Pararhizobium sp. TaxID=1977563 RepID=UPI00271E137B|nr:hypothetical protein [Pararhizobium sp.]MDO9417325.1 hypothetical protein [Pararhizobium sp.]
MATVTGFESLRHPSRSDLRQFAELFEPLYEASSDEARRQAVAALSQCTHIPQPTAFFIGTRPIAIAAIFLTRSRDISDDVLIAIAGLNEPSYGRAIARRENLSPKVVDALVSQHHGSGHRLASATPEATADAALPDLTALVAVGNLDPTPDHSADSSTDRLRREEDLRQDLKALVRSGAPRLSEPDPLAEGVSDMQEALLVRFARSGETGLLAAVLADCLRSSRALSDRILLDTSGQQLAVTLTALDVTMDDSIFVLEALYPEVDGHAAAILSAIDVAEAIARVHAWQRADGYSGHAVSHQSVLAPDRENDPRMAAARAQPLFGRAAQERKQRLTARR